MNTRRAASRRGLLSNTMLASAAALTASLGLATVAVMPNVACAQDYTSGSLTGTVEDDAGAPVAGARVIITSEQGATRETTTDAEGTFRVPALAVGTYTVRVQAEGYSTAENAAVQVAPGGASYGFTLAAGELGEVVVTGSRRQRDFNRTDTGLSVDVQETAERVPVGRDVTSIVQLAPGSGFADPTIQAVGVRRNQTVATLAGSSAAESVYYINGLNVTDQRTFLGYADLPFDAIRTIDVKTGGYQAEYGRATGGVLNIVTRSGSNELEGGASVFVTPNGLRSERGESYQAGTTNGVPGQVIYNDAAESSLTEGSIWASGPIWRDRLFVFANVNPRRLEEYRPAVSTGAAGASRAAGTQTYVYSNTPRWFAKVDLNLSADHRLEASVFSDRAETDYQPYAWSLADGRGAKRANWTEESGGLNQIYKYTGVFADWFTASALYGQVESIYRDVGPAVSIPRINDRVRGVLVGPGTGGSFDLSGEDMRKTYRVDFDLYGDFFGEHHLRFGYDREDIRTVANNATSGGGDYALRQGDVDGDGDVDDYAEITLFANNGAFEAEQSALYVQDSWTATDRLTVQAGLRWDKYDYKNIRGVSYAKIDDQVAPRLGFTLDPTGDRSSRVYGSFGHYYLPIATNTSIRASSGETYYTDTFAISRNADGTPVLGADGRPVLGAQLLPRTYLSPPGGPDPRTVAEADLKPMYEREFILGYEKDFDFGWTLGVRYIDRDLASAIEDTAIGEAFARYCVRTATACSAVDPSDGSVYTPADGGSFADLFPYILINPGDGARVFIDPDIAGPAQGSYVNLTAADLALPEVERTYRALEFTFQRPFDGVWGVQGSYTLGMSQGNYEGAVKSDVGQTDTSLTQDFDHAYTMVGARGYLPNDRRHQLKVFGTYALNENLRFGANVRAESGRKYSCIGYSPDPSNFFGTPSSWYCPDGNGNRVASPRGSRGETDFLAQLDLNAAYTQPLPGRMGQLRASVDVFNVLDADAVTRVVEQGEVRAAKGTPTPFYGMPRSYQPARSVRLGLQYKF